MNFGPKDFWQKNTFEKFESGPKLRFNTRSQISENRLYFRPKVIFQIGEWSTLKLFECAFAIHINMYYWSLSPAHTTLARFEEYFIDKPSLVYKYRQYKCVVRLLSDIFWYILLAYQNLESIQFSFSALHLFWAYLFFFFRIKNLVNFFHQKDYKYLFHLDWKLPFCFFVRSDFFFEIFEISKNFWNFYYFWREGNRRIVIWQNNSWIQEIEGKP